MDKVAKIILIVEGNFVCLIYNLANQSILYQSSSASTIEELKFIMLPKNTRNLTTDALPSMESTTTSSPKCVIKLENICFLVNSHHNLHTSHAVQLTSRYVVFDLHTFHQHVSALLRRQQ